MSELQKILDDRKRKLGKFVNKRGRYFESLELI
jgi:hypothetical protein